MLERRTGWYFTPTGELRECVVVSAGAFGSGPMVLDAQTGKAVSVRPEDVMTEAPDPPE